MQVCVIQKTEPKNVNIPVAAAAGGAAGLALRQLYPVYQQERDYVLFGQPNATKEYGIKLVKQNTIAETNKLINQNPDNEALKLFLERIKNAGAKLKAVKEKISAAPVEIQEKVKLLSKEYASKLKATQILNDANIKAAIKNKRPVGAFLLPGLILGTVCAFVYNVVGKMNQN